jgi:hypothetical protein
MINHKRSAERAKRPAVFYIPPHLFQMQKEKIKILLLRVENDLTFQIVFDIMYAF